MELHFYKYHGTGNDFVMVDDRTSSFDISDKQLIANICKRRFGVGADGLILLRDHPEVDFEMIYFNADGAQSSMCGNGGRCIVAFADFLGLIDQECTFIAIDGRHEGKVNSDKSISIKMSDVDFPTAFDQDLILDTGSPHYVTEVEDISLINVFEEGRAIRYSSQFKETGINVNFVKSNDDFIEVATYERGVEDETYSCGTGVVAATLAQAYIHKNAKGMQPIKTKGGDMRVSFEESDVGYINVWLTGPAIQVFEGKYTTD